MCHFIYLTRLKTISAVLLHKFNEYVYYLLTILTVITILYNEWIIYSLYASNWPKFFCGNKNYCTTVMLVADPQILGNENENILARWDNDRYLFNTYGRAFQHTKPDNIVFLGDLMDEGSLADQQSFEKYLLRFCKIFFLKNTIPLASQNVIFIPGDNDIGGEREIVIREKVDRFHTYFGSPEVIEKNNVQFIVVNNIIETMPINKMYFKNNTKAMKLIFSHVPLTTKWTKFTDKVLQEFKNEFIFSAHDHSSFNIISNTSSKERLFVQRLNHSSFNNMSQAQWRFGQLPKNVVNEIIVPSCSYRMGTENIGYGVLTIDTFRHSVTYSILWLPSRFISFYLYLYAIVICICLYIFHLYTRDVKFPMYRVL
ncbi:uncharacterized protein LOC126902570 [Daktulosphaira vitifoliae]|uniref:uncharacterized protein LOC126902570 n=1 Tax=Daktulosphaira vitifoliae TaxID=58002 RepID=UPI0021A9C97D|nr:uncharacterized protein LOC126902570 [Daktulosphaira vitifoliae]